MESKFKVGDKVKLVGTHYGDSISNPVWGRKEGNVAGVIKSAESGGSYTVAWSNGRTNTAYRQGRDIALVEEKRKRGRPAKVRPMKFLLKYDLDEDPIEEFATMEEVKKRVQELLKDKARNGLKTDSIFVYEIASKHQIKIKESLAVVKLN